MSEKCLTGRVVTGIGEGSFFTGLDWVREQFRCRLGIDPYPGTVNLQLNSDHERSVWHSLSASAGVRIDNPGSGPRDCDARCYPVLINGCLKGAIVLPEVPGYPRDKVEIVADTNLRDALDLADGDQLTLEFSDLALGA